MTDWNLLLLLGTVRQQVNPPPHTPIYLKFAATLSDTVGEEHLMIALLVKFTNNI